MFLSQIRLVRYKSKKTIFEKIFNFQSFFLFSFQTRKLTEQRRPITRSKEIVSIKKFFFFLSLNRFPILLSACQQQQQQKSNTSISINKVAVTTAAIAATAVVTTRATRATTTVEAKIAAVTTARAATAPCKQGSNNSNSDNSRKQDTDHVSKNNILAERGQVWRSQGMQQDPAPARRETEKAEIQSGSRRDGSEQLGDERRQRRGRRERRG